MKTHGPQARACVELNWMGPWDKTLKLHCGRDSSPAAKRKLERRDDSRGKQKQGDNYKGVIAAKTAKDTNASAVNYFKPLLRARLRSSRIS